MDPLTGQMSAVAASPGLIHYYLGKSYQWLGRDERAVAELKQAAALNPLDPAAQLGLAYSYVNVGRTQEAKDAARKAIAIGQEIDPARQSKEVQYDMGLAYELLGRVDDALEMYDWVISELDPDFYIAYVSAGRLYAGAGEYAKALGKYDLALAKAEKAGHSGAWTHLDMAKVYLGQGDVARAREAFQTAVRLEPEQDWLHYQLARFYEGQAEIDTAWSEYEAVVRVSGSKAWAYAELARFLRRQGLIEESIGAYRKAIRANPEDGMLSVSLAQIYSERYTSGSGQEDDAQHALNAFGEALRAFPEDSSGRFDAYAHRARLHFDRQSFDLARADFDAALAVNPASPEIRYSLALTYDILGEGERACKAYEQVLDPDIQAAESLTEYARSRMASLCAP